MLLDGEPRFIYKYEQNMSGGNDQWANPGEAIQVGEVVGEELVGRFAHLDSLNTYPAVTKCARKAIEAALDVIDYAALPTERRANILRGVINSLENTGALGGEPEWAETTKAPETGQGRSDIPPYGHIAGI